MLNWIVWNRTVFDILTGHLWKTELFEIELFIFIEMDLALNNLKCLIYHKTKPKQRVPALSLFIYLFYGFSKFPFPYGASFFNFSF